MNLSKEQLEQCRKDFEDWYKNEWYADYISAGIGFQAAWRPIPSVEEISKIFYDSYLKEIKINDGIIAIHRAFGGKS